eukprot:315690_1
MSSSWNDQFGVGATLESTDGATYNVLKPVVDPKAPKYEEPSNLNVPSLAEQLAVRKAEEEEEYRQRHRNLPPKALDEEEVFFLEAIQREEQIKQDLKHKQEQKDIDSFNNALQNRVIKLNDSDQIIPIDLQINKEVSPNKTSSDIVVAPNVHNNHKSKVNLDGVVLLKKVKKKKKKKKHKKEKGKDKDDQERRKKKRKLKELNEVSDSNPPCKKRKAFASDKGSDPPLKLSEWERD